MSFDADAVRQAYYERFDRTVAKLPAVQRSRADLLQSLPEHRDPGLWNICDKAGTLVATVRDPLIPAPPSKSAPRPQSQSQSIAKAEHMAGIKAVSEVISDALAPIVNRLEAMEMADRVDATGFDELGKAFERIDALESRPQGLNYRGYWRPGMKATAGDAMTEQGSLWIALRETTAKPCIENANDWCLGARRGRDYRPT